MLTHEKRLMAVIVHVEIMFQEKYLPFEFSQFREKGASEAVDWI